MGEERWARGESQRPHYNLEAWKGAMVLVRVVYELTRKFPAEELYGLTGHVSALIEQLADIDVAMPQLSCGSIPS